MSQFIGPAFLPTIQQNYQTQYSPYQAQNQNYSYVNPYQTSFYNSYGVTYPFNNPIYQPKISQEYSYLGLIKSPNNDAVSVFQLKSGQKVAIMPKKGQATIVKTFLNGGSMNETDRLRGLSHTIEHMLFKGSSKLKDGDVFKLTGLMGASTNASTDYAQTDYYINAPYMDKQNLAKSIEIQGDMISSPSFDPEALRLEKGPICSEISMMNDDVSTVAFDKVVRNLFQINSSSKNMVAGSIDTVQSFSSDDLANHHQTFYSPSDLYTVVVGDVDVDETIDLISKNFTIKPTIKNSGPKYKVDLNPIQSPLRQDMKSKKTNNTTVMFAFAGPKPSDAKAFVIWLMLQTYLPNFSTSDLKNDLEKISGDFGMTFQKVGLSPIDPYALIGIMDVNSKDDQKGIDIFYDAIQKLQNAPLNDTDLIAIKNSLYKDLEYDLCNSSECCNMLGVSLMNASDLFSDYREIIESVTKEDIQNFARNYLDLNRVSMVVVHPDGVSDEEINNNYMNSKYSLSRLKNPLPSGVVSFCGAPRVSTETIREYKLKNNTHLIVNDTDSRVCVFNWKVNTPPIKPKNPNTSDVLAYLFKKGSKYKTQTELEQYKELNGITSEISVNPRSIEITADCLSKDADKTIKLMNELMYCPRFTQKDFEEAKRYVKDMLIAAQKDASSNLLDSLYPGYFPGISQKLKKIDELKLDDVVEFYQQLLSSASSNFVATLPLREDSTLSHRVIDGLNESSTVFKDSVPKLTSLYSPNPQPNVVYDTDDLNQAQIYKTYKFPLSGNIDDEAKFELVNEILGGSANARLFQDLREQQNLAYSVYSDVRSFENTGILSLNILTTTDHKDQGQTSYDNVQKALEGFKKHTDKMCSEFVSDEELEAAKMKLKQNLFAICQNPVTETGLISMNMLEPYGIKRIDKYLDAIDRVTKEDIKNTANFIFSQNPTISILASPDTINNQMDYLKTLGKIEQANSGS